MVETETGRSRRSDRLDSIEEALRRPRAVVLHRDGRVVAASDGFRRMLGLSDVEGSRPPYPWWPKRDQRALAAVLGRVLAGAVPEAEGQTLRLVLRHAGGRSLPVDVAFHRVRGDHVCFTHEPVDEPEAATVDRTRLRAARRLLAAAAAELDAATGRAPRWRRVEPGPPLTDREEQVLALLLEGRRGDRIAEILGLSPNTVKHHIRAVFRKRGVTSHVELLARFLGGRRSAGPAD